MFGLFGSPNEEELLDSMDAIEEELEDDDIGVFVLAGGEPELVGEDVSGGEVEVDEVVVAMFSDFTVIPTPAVIVAMLFHLPLNHRTTRHHVRHHAFDHLVCAITIALAILS